MTPLATDPTPDWAPRWSPDGNEIAFYSYRSGNRDIWVMPSRGGPARQLTSDPGHDYYPSWSPDGRIIAYQSRGKASTILMNAKGGDSRSLGTGVLTPSQVEWSRDGRSLLFLKNGHLFRVSRDGGAPTEIPIRSDGGEPYTIRVSRDGQSIYYSVITGPREKHDFWKLSLSDGAVSRITKLEGRRGDISDALAVDVEKTHRRVGPQFVARKTWIDVGCEPATDVAAREYAEYYLSGTCVVKSNARCMKIDRRLFVLVDAEHFEPGPGRIQVACMQRVAVTKAGRKEALAVIVDHHRSVNDFITAIRIDVGDGEAVVTLS